MLILLVAIILVVSLWTNVNYLPRLVITIATLIIGLVIYFAPSLVAEKKQKKNKKAILALNFFLGWTLVGWVVALVWALTVDEPAKP